MIFLPQPPGVRLKEALLRDELGYKSAMPNSLVYRPIHPDIDF